VRVRAVCLPNSQEAGRLDLAAVGANARRATEDSTAIAYLEAHDARRTRFARPILEAAEIASIAADSGAVAMVRLHRAIASAEDATNLREYVYRHR